MSSSNSGSKSDLNESNMPLLDDVEKSGETPEKEQIEMKEEGDKEKDDSKEKEKDKKKKDKKKKEPKDKMSKGPSCIDTLSAGLDLAARDGKAINAEINVDFDDVLAEPITAQGFDPIWKLTYVLFSQTKLWLYRIFSAVLAVPIALLWAVVFSIITVAYVWLVAPAFRLLDLFVYSVRRVLNGFLYCTIEPIFSAIGSVFSKVHAQPPKSHLVEEA